MGTTDDMLKHPALPNEAPWPTSALAQQPTGAAYTDDAATYHHNSAFFRQA
jgi:hypothetical protein